jgi:hypothetical protein
MTITQHTINNTLTPNDLLEYNNTIEGIKHHKSIKRGLLIKRGKTGYDEWIKRELITQEIQSINHTINGLMSNIDVMLNKYPTL